MYEFIIFWKKKVDFIDEWELGHLDLNKFEK